MAQTTTVSERPLSVRRSVLTLAWPAIIDQTLAMVLGMVDTAMVGRIGAHALASVGLGSQLMQASTAIFGAVTTGTTALVARSIGARDYEAASNTARQSVVFGSLLAGAVGLCLIAFAPQILGALFSTSDPEVLTHAAEYVRIVAAALVAQFLLIVSNGTLRGSGDTRTPMLVMAAINVVNAAVNYLLIWGVGPFPRLEIRGAAIATALSQVTGAAISLGVLVRGKNGVRLDFRRLRPDFAALRRVLRIGIPAGVEQIMMQAGQMVYTMIIASLGTVAYAAHRVALNAESLSYMPGFGFALAATTLVGQGLGAGDIQRAERSGNESARLAMLTMGTMGVFFFVAPQFFIRFFTPDPAVTDLAARVLRIVAVSQPFLAMTMVLGGALRGAGDTRAVLGITVAGVVIVRVGVAYALVRAGFGLVGAWIGMVTDLAIRGSLIRYRFSLGRWKHLRV